MIGNLVGSTLTPKLPGIGLLLWAVSLFGLWACMQGRISAAAEVARAESRTECATEKAATAETAKADQALAIAQARAEWVAKQAEVDRQKADDRARIERDLSAQRRRADTLFRQLQAHIDAVPLPADCRLGPSRVRLYNDARRGADPATGPG